jgi:hypothetical protein
MYTPCNEFCLFSRSELMLYWGSIGAGTGALVGALVGASRSGNEPAEARSAATVRLVPAPQGRVSLVVSRGI